jgi:hypothetical protein
MYMSLGKGRYVLDTNQDPYAKAAMEAYADASDPAHPERAAALRAELGSYAQSLACAETAWRLFHVAWNIAKHHDGYDKRVWAQVSLHFSLLRRRFHAHQPPFCPSRK